MGVKKVCLEKDKYKEFLEYVYLHSDIAGDPMYRAGNSLYPFYVFGIEVCRQQ
jgi:hypothetical protein